MTEESIENDYAWLLDPRTQPLIEQVASQLDGGRATPTPAMLERLRKDNTAERASLVLQQVALRHRARRKFRLADQMFFTSVLLEQSTSEFIARYKATLFPQGALMDLCCGIGGDAVGMAAAGKDVTVLDRSTTATCMAIRNAEAYKHESATIQRSVRDAAKARVDEFAAWHIDPDRRPHGSRTTHVEGHEPGLDALNGLLSRNENAAIKLAPATEIPDAWIGRCEREWIGEQRECKQQLLRFGSLARTTDEHAATIIDDSGAPIASMSGTFDEPAIFTSNVGEFIYEPHASVRAAGLTGALANRLGLKRIGLATSYMTGDAVASDALLTQFRVLDSMPFDRKRVRKRIRDLALGHLEIKTRGLKIEPPKEQKCLTANSDGEPGCVFLFATEGKATAVITQRTGSMRK